MLLRDYLDTNKIQYQKFAEELEVNRTYFYNILSGRRRVSRALAKKIEKLSKGCVTRLECLYPEDFIDEDKQMRFKEMPV